MDELKVNQWMQRDRVEPFATLRDGTSLFPAYYHQRPCEAYRRRMGLWTGQTGEWVGVTLEGQLYRQGRYWGSEAPRPGRWERFRIIGS
jgi:hypothetical protein